MPWGLLEPSPARIGRALSCYARLPSGAVRPRSRQDPVNDGAEPPVVLQAPEDRFNDPLPLLVDRFPAFRVEFLAKLADLCMVRSQLNTAKSFRTVRAPHAKGTNVAIGAGYTFVGPRRLLSLTNGSRFPCGQMNSSFASSYVKRLT